MMEYKKNMDSEVDAKAASWYKKYHELLANLSFGRAVCSAFMGGAFWYRSMIKRKIADAKSVEDVIKIIDAFR